MQLQSAWAQNEITEQLDFERVIENLLPQQEYDVDYSDLYDRLFTIYSNPLDLNKVDHSDLQALFFLSEIQIGGILDYRSKYGDFLTVFELISIEGFNEEVVKRLIPFIYIDLNQKESLYQSFGNPDNHELFIRYQRVLEQKKGYTDPDTTSSGGLTSRYKGDPNRLYARYLYSKTGQYSFGFTVEKDPGELITWDAKTARYGLDYYSFHGMIENQWKLKKIVFGDFSMDYGQGLIFGSGIRIGKGFEPVTTIRRNNMGLRPYRSVYENKDFSGASISLDLNPIEVNIFYSYVKRDAILRSDAIADAEQFISYIQKVGLHRTASEISAKHTITDQSVGGNINFKSMNKKLEVGLNGIYTKYDIPLKLNLKTYSQFDFQGIHNILGGVYTNYYFKRAHAFGEAALSENGGKAISAGIIGSLSSQVQASIHFRTYDKQFHSFYGEAFGENTKIGNEQGIYWGLKVTPIRNLVLSTYFDLYSFPWLKYQVDAPSKGRDFMFAGSYPVTDNFRLLVQYRNKTSEINFTDESSPFARVEARNSQRLRLELNYELGENFTGKTRVQNSWVNFVQLNSSGFILAQDVTFTNKKYAISGRFALFDTDNYDNRQFIYEKDLLYVYSVPSFYNKGVRYYLMGKIDCTRRLTLWIKFAQSHYVNIDSIGSGLEEISGNKKSSIGVQARFRL